MCECGSTRVISVYMKCNDLASVKIEHLNIEIDGYLPDIGVFGGSENEFDICLDCGRCAMPSVKIGRRIQRRWSFCRKSARRARVISV